ncbi:MAG: hypothetical protein ACLSHG_10690 [Oscillospiraceae bacterium]
MKTFWTKKNIAIVLAVLLVAAVVVLCIALRQKSVEDTEPTLTLTCQSADADGACTVDVVLSGLPDGAHYGRRASPWPLTRRRSRFSARRTGTSRS